MPIVVPGSDLPRLGWHHRTRYDRARFQPVSNPDLTAMPGQPGWGQPTKPRGGLWTSPLLRGECTAWSTVIEVDTAAAPVVADRYARVLRLDRHADVVELVETRPRPLDMVDTLARELLLRMFALIDWPALADQVDGVWLTRHGMQETELAMGGLRQWDCETVLWLQPRFRVGITCPRCGRTSWSPTDVVEGYCGACHDWTTIDQ